MAIRGIDSRAPVHGGTGSGGALSIQTVYTVSKQRDGGLPARERGTVELFNRFDGSSQSLEQRKSHEKGKGSR